MRNFFTGHTLASHRQGSRSLPADVKCTWRKSSDRFHRTSSCAVCTLAKLKSLINYFMVVLFDRSSFFSFSFSFFLQTLVLPLSLPQALHGSGHRQGCDLTCGRQPVKEKRWIGKTRWEKRERKEKERPRHRFSKLKSLAMIRQVCNMFMTFWIIFQKMKYRWHIVTFSQLKMHRYS